MANDPGADSFFGTNYAKMLDALDRVGDPNRAAILRGGRSGVFTDVAKSRKSISPTGTASFARARARN